MFLEITKNELKNYRGQGLSEVFKNRLGLLIRDYWTPAARHELVQKVKENRNHWTHFPGRLHYAALGNALYGFRAIDDLDAYFLSAKASDQMMARLFPDLEKSLVEPFQTLAAPHPVKKRKGFCGPGIVIQTEDSEHHPHFDVNEGLNEVLQLFPLDEMLLTMVGMLQKPPSGGRLFLWDQSFDPTQEYGAQVNVDATLPDYALDYPEGSLAILNGMKLHEIEASAGERITANLHFMRRADNSWTYWF